MIDNKIISEVKKLIEEVERLQKETKNKFSAEECQRLWSSIADRDEDIERLEKSNVYLKERVSMWETFYYDMNKRMMN